ncbi:unnamed protein product [Trichobilharzia szidati]|nr:unnamed protein product [Trichobilharzia szidati]
MNTSSSLAANDITTNTTDKNEHFIRAFQCFFSLFSNPNLNDHSKLMHVAKYISRPGSKSFLLPQMIDTLSEYKVPSTTSNSNNNNNIHIATNNAIHRENVNTSSRANHITYQSSLSIPSELHKTLHCPSSTDLISNMMGKANWSLSYRMEYANFNESLNGSVNFNGDTEGNAHENPLDLSMSSNLNSSPTNPVHTTVNMKSYSSKEQITDKNQSLPMFHINCDYTSVDGSNLTGAIHLSDGFPTKRRRSSKHNTNRRNTADKGNNKNQCPEADINNEVDLFMKSKTLSNRLQQLSTISSTSSSLSPVSHLDCSPPGKQPVTRCNHCHVLFPSLYELNNHFITEHNVILQAEMEHTKSWKSHTIDDACLQNMKVILNRSNNMHTSGYPCPNCDYVAKWPTELQKHIMVHSKQRPHRCIICGLSYKWKWDLGRHFDKSHNRTMNPYKKNVFNHSQNQENRLKNAHKCSARRVQKSSIRKHLGVKHNSYTVVDGYIPFPTSPVGVNTNQLGEFCNAVKQDIVANPVNLSGYTHVQSI